MRKRDKKYSGEYMINPSATRYSDDSVVYIGKWYRFEKDEKTVKRAKISLLVLSILNMAFFALGGFIDTEASFTPYVFLPYIIMFLPLALSVGCTVTVMTFGEKLTHKQYDKKILSQKAYSYASAVMASVTLVCDIVMYAIRDSFDVKKDLIFTACAMIIVILSVLSVKMQKNLKCSCDNQ